MRESKVKQQTGEGNGYSNNLTKRDNTMATKKQIPVMITTEHRGVFFGYLASEEDRAQPTLTLTNVRMAIYWSKDVGGVLGLTVGGPSKGCRIGPPCPKLTLQKVTSVADVSKEAVKAWESASQSWR